MLGAFKKILNRHIHIFIDKEIEIGSILSLGIFLNEKIVWCQRLELGREFIILKDLRLFPVQ